MSSFSRTLICTAVAMALAGPATASDRQTGTVKNGPDPNRVMVTYKPGSRDLVTGALGFGRFAQKSVGAQMHHQFDNLNTIVATVPEAALEGLRNNPNVLAIEVDAPRYPMAQTVPYGVPMVQAPDLVATGADGSGIKVCIIDSGIKSDHEDFAGISMTGQSGQNWGSDSCGHGTHVAGTIAAANNSVGVVGVSPGKVSLHIVKVFDGASCGWSYSSSLIAAANECASAGAKIISMSLGGGTSSTTESNGFANLYSQGILNIAAAGNAGNTTKSYPASYDSVMSVAAVDSAGALASFSQRNDQVEIAAPGVAVLSTYPIASATTSVGGTGYIVAAMTNSPQLSRSGAVVDGGICDSVGSWSGKVVLCQRGSIAFEDKVMNAQRGGAVAAIVYNNVSGSFGGTLSSPTQTTIPSVSMSMEDGNEIKASKLGQTAAVSTVANNNASAYASLDGTSMATPHVSGVAAIVWSAKPTATAAEVRAALTSTAVDLGTAGRDNSFGYGLVQAMDAAEALVNGGGGNPPPATAPSSLTGSKSYAKGKYTYRLNWTGGAATVDVYRGTSKIKSAISNTGTTTWTNKVSSGTFKVCNAGSTTECSNSVSL